MFEWNKHTPSQENKIDWTCWLYPFVMPVLWSPDHLPFTIYHLPFIFFFVQFNFEPIFFHFIEYFAAIASSIVKLDRNSNGNGNTNLNNLGKWIPNSIRYVGAGYYLYYFFFFQLQYYLAKWCNLCLLIINRICEWEKGAFIDNSKY